MNYIKRNIRPNILNLKAYSCARNEFKLNSNSGYNNVILLDANENPFNTSYNRYPDPNQTNLREIISECKGVDKDQICFGNGSDEIIDLLIRSSCVPSKDNILYFYPGYGMYEVYANINDVENRHILLDDELKYDFNKLLERVDANSKIIFLCNPHNPTGLAISCEEIEKVCKNFEGWVVVDEAYIDFSLQNSALKLLSKNKNLIVMQTMSKAYGLAGLRLGMCFANKELIALLNNIRAPYNINSETQNLVVENLKSLKLDVDIIISERNNLINKLRDFSYIKKVYESSANFILIKCIDALSLYKFLITRNCIVRLRDISPNMSNCIRLTVGNPAENIRLLKNLEEFEGL